VRLEQLKDPHTVLPDEAVPDSGRTLKLGNTVLELKYMGLNHSDTNLVMLLPKEKLVFIVDTLPVGQVPGRGMIDFHPFETEQFIKEVIALDWDRLIPGHPGPGDRLGTRRKDAQDQLVLLQSASAEMKKLAQDGKCWGHRREGVQAVGLRVVARLRERRAVHRAAVLRPVGSRNVMR